jgi:predicted Zn-dependent protease
MRLRRWKQWSAVALALPLMAVTNTHAEHLRIGDRVLRWSRTPDATTTTITYAVLTTNFVLPIDRPTLSPDNCGSMRPFDGIVATSPEVSAASAKRQLMRAFAAWRAMANIVFVESADPERADIVIGAGSHRNGAAANLSFRAPPIETILSTSARHVANADISDLARHQMVPIHQAYVCLDPNWQWKVGFDGNLTAYDLRHTFIHEIGHTIGLDHPGPTGALMGFRYDERATDLQPSDIASVQALYGPPQQE